MARAADAFVCFWGEYGGSDYLVAAARDVRCTNGQLEEVLAMLDQHGWDDFRNAGIRYVARPQALAALKPRHLPIGTGEIWIAQRLFHLADVVLDVLLGTPSRAG